jgi:hypothetical protein
MQIKGSKYTIFGTHHQTFWNHLFFGKNMDRGLQPHIECDKKDHDSFKSPSKIFVRIYWWFSKIVMKKIFPGLQAITPDEYATFFRTTI